MASSSTLLVVDDEDLLRWSVRQRLEAEGYRVLDAATGGEAGRLCDEESVDLVLLDVRLPDGDGLALLQRLRHSSPDTLVILMTAYSTIESAVEAIKEGAYHYVNKPFEMDELMLLVEKALETTALRREVRALRARESEPYSFEYIIGASPALEEVKALLRKITASPAASTVLLTGESGTGKDLIAKVVHYNSERAAGPFMHIICSAVPEALLESELFGHERGAFTDARTRKKGLLELADRGTVFLDEIGEMSPGLQAKLLRFLEEKRLKRVGGTEDIALDVRVVAATNRDLEQEVREGRFRQDLYYRLSVLPVALPPLRARLGDTALLARYYIDCFNREFRRSVRALSPAAAEALDAHSWPGNVRELRNVIERAVLLAEGDVLELADLAPLSGAARGDGAFALPPEGIDFDSLERDLVAQALHRTGGNQTRAAALLGMNRDQIRYRIEKFGLSAREPGS
ncbi:MAG TPA: sigma-54 dependent transcriptional regulator [Thermoanaerobaculia bacterium]|nr:sigma-54 dependent transcriptional regulator [Thermoanaerobaculia bacterium]